MKHIFTVHEAAAYLGISVGTIHYYVRKTAQLQPLPREPREPLRFDKAQLDRIRVERQNAKRGDSPQRKTWTKGTYPVRRR